jgi:beta-glucanase (GH16 family)
MAVRRFGIFLVLTAFAVILSQSSLANTRQKDIAPKAPPGEWKLVLAEEFDGGKLNSKLWTTCYWWDDGGCTNLGNKEMQWYMPANVTVSDGVLHLTARPEKVRGYRGRTYAYTSGIVTSGRYHRELPRPPRFEMQYGHIEVRAKAPKGKGLWSALWLLPSDHEAHPEIDIMEILGDSTNKLRMHLHYLDRRNKRQNPGHTVTTSDLSGDWHVYGSMGARLYRVVSQRC